jgi:prophage maintenance system killer protein
MQEKQIKDIPGGQIVLYQNKVEVRLVQDTVWLRQEQIADLFGTKRPAITKHLANIFKSKELNENSVCSILEHTAADNKVYKTKFYNLDAIISVGYRVNSGKATQFRIWATNILRKYLVNGYALNERRLKSQADKIKELREAVNLLKNVVSLDIVSEETKGIIQIVAEYTRALDILDDYDHDRLATPKGTQKKLTILSYEEAKEIIAAMKKKFHDSALVGQEKDNSFKSSIGAIYQTFDGKELYPTIEEKASHLLYFITKNHSFVDGNKRIAAALFICFLHKNKILLKKDGTRRIDDNALAALTLMIAVSKPSEKDTMIKVILNLLNA